MYLFGSREWGPQPITQLIMSVSDGTSAMVTARDAGIKTVADLKGRRVAWVKSAASLQNSIRGHLAFAGLTWDDVIKVEVPGYAASVQAVIDGQADAAYGTTNSAPFLKIEASPRGLRFLPLPHDDEAGWKRLLDVPPSRRKDRRSRRKACRWRRPPIRCWPQCRSPRPTRTTI